MGTKRTAPHTPKLNNEQKKPRLDCQRTPAQHEISVVGEYCNVHLRPSFTTKALSYNSSIGSLCVIRQIDSTERTSSPLSLVEFYNARKPPLIFLEKSIPVNDHFEALVWMGNWAVLGGSGGRATSLSPFTSKFSRVQVCVSDILVMALSDKNQFVVGNNSSELLVLSSRDTVDINKVPALATVQTIKLFSDEHITSLACSNTTKPRRMAVGKVNGLSLFLHETHWKKHKEIIIPHTKDSANIIWSLLFVDSFLFTGDARGQMSIYDTENGTLLKTLKTHQCSILTIATNGTEIYAAGVDYRIQVLKGIPGNNQSEYDFFRKDRLEWQPSGQRLFHANDVRAICALDKHWLVSGGSEQELFISDKYTHANPQIKAECASFVTKSNYYVIVSLHLSHLDLWCRAIDAPLADHRSGLRRLLRITSGKLGFIKQFCLSPNGKFLAFAGAVGGVVRVFHLNYEQIPKLFSANNSDQFDTCKLIKLIWNSDQQHTEDVQKQTKDTGGKAVSALYCTDKFLYFARGEFNLVRLDLQTKRLLPFFAKVSGGHVIKLCVASDDSLLVVLTIAGVSFSDLTKLANDESCQIGDEELIALKLPTNVPVYDCAFYDKCKLILLTANLSQHVILFDLASNATLSVFENSKLHLASNEWITYLHVNSVNSTGTIVGTSNKGRLRLLNLIEGKMRLFAQEPTESPEDEISKSASIRIEPFWLENCSDQSPNCSKSTFLLVRHTEENTPSRVPCRLRFFGRN